MVYHEQLKSPIPVEPRQVEEQRIHQLEDKLRRKHEVLSELLEEHIQLKKELGEL